MHLRFPPTSSCVELDSDAVASDLLVPLSSCRRDLLCLDSACFLVSDVAQDWVTKLAQIPTPFAACVAHSGDAATVH